MKLKYIVLFLLMFSDLYSKNIITIGDTTIGRTGNYFVKIDGELDSNITNVEMKVTYDADIIDIKDVIGGVGKIFLDETPIAEKSGNSKDAYIILKCNNLNHIATTFFDIEIRGLAHRDSISVLNVEYIKSNGVDINFQSTPGKIKVLPPIQLTYKNGVGLPFPNPFIYETVLEIALNDSLQFNIKIFDAQGELKEEYPSNSISPEFTLLNLRKEIVEYTRDSSLPKDLYRLVFRPNRIKWSQGAYYIVAEIDGEVYHSQIIIRN